MVFDLQACQGCAALRLRDAALSTSVELLLEKQFQKITCRCTDIYTSISIYLSIHVCIHISVYMLRNNGTEATSLPMPSSPSWTRPFDGESARPVGLVCKSQVLQNEGIQAYYSLPLRHGGLFADSGKAFGCFPIR